MRILVCRLVENTYVRSRVEATTLVDRKHVNKKKVRITRIQGATYMKHSVIECNVKRFRVRARVSLDRDLF